MISIKNNFHLIDSDSNSLDHKKLIIGLSNMLPLNDKLEEDEIKWSEGSSINDYTTLGEKGSRILWQQCYY